MFVILVAITLSHVKILTCLTTCDDTIKSLENIIGE